MWRFFKQNWHILFNLSLTVFIVVLAIEQSDINKRQLDITKDQKSISEQQLSLSLKQDKLINEQAKLAEKQFQLSSSLAHQDIEPEITCWMDFPKQGPFHVEIANRGPINIVSLSVEYWEVDFNAKDEVKIIGSSYGGGGDPRYFFFKAGLMPGERVAVPVGLGLDRSMWSVYSDEKWPEGSRLVRAIHIIKLTYHRDTDLRRFSKTVAFEIDLKTISGKRIDVFEKHPDYPRIKVWLEKHEEYKTHKGWSLDDSREPR